MGILTTILLMPLVAMVLVMLTPRGKDDVVRGIAALSTFASMLLSMKMYYDFLNLEYALRANWQFVERLPWFPDLGIAYIVGVDGLNAPMVLLTGILAFASSVVSFGIKERVKEYYALALASIAGVFGIFMSLDLFFFILFYEMASVPLYFLLGIWGSVPKSGPRKVSIEYAATKLILYLQLGGGLAFLGILALWWNVTVPGATPGALMHTFDLTAIMAELGKNPLPHAVQTWLFPVMFIGFAVEGGFVPFHTWLPDGHSSAPTALSMLLAGVLLKMGSYGVLRLAIAPMPDGARTWMPFFMVLATVNVVYGALCALRQVDIKYLIAYSSVSHMGVVFLGLGCSSLGANNVMGVEGAVFQMFSHGVVTAMLFGLAGYVYEKTHTRNIEEMGGLAFRMPFLAATFTMAALASLGLPGLSGFVAEALVFFGLYRQNQVLTIVTVLALVVTATYLLRCVQKIFFGPSAEAHGHGDGHAHEKLTDIGGFQKVGPVVLGLTSLVVGICPSILLNAMHPSVVHLLSTLGGVQQ
ncbi:MAG: NADH-quinone oxidoreductase subunit M [Proteobacteria bacterium]|nr:NADH-quinone oxidoreductase subunit M [Pseudomonadota bacterium]